MSITTHLRIRKKCAKENCATHYPAAVWRTSFTSNVVVPPANNNIAPLAQSVERRPFKPVVVGSSPTGGAILYKSNDPNAVAGVKMLRVRIELTTLGL